MKRRHFVSAVSGATLLAWLGSSGAQTGKAPRVGILLLNASQSEPIGPLLESLKETGRERGRAIEIDSRHADGRPERLPAAAAELVNPRPDVIFVVGGDVVPFAKAATTTIPIVAMVSNDPVKSGLVASLGHGRQCHRDHVDLRRARRQDAGVSESGSALDDPRGGALEPRPRRPGVPGDAAGWRRPTA